MSGPRSAAAALAQGAGGGAASRILRLTPSAIRGNRSAMSLACSSSILRMSSTIRRVVGSSFASQRMMSE